MDQQHWNHTAAYFKHKTSDPTQDLLNQNLHFNKILKESRVWRYVDLVQLFYLQIKKLSFKELVPNRKAIYIRVARPGTLIWMLWLIHFHCVWKEDILLKCPRNISSNSASSFNPQTKPVSPYQWEPSHFSLHPSWIITIFLLQNPWMLFSKHPSLLISTTHFLHTCTQTDEQSWRNITQLK